MKSKTKLRWVTQVRTAAGYREPLAGIIKRSGARKVIYQIIAVCTLSGIAGRKKPMYGGLAGLILSPLTHIIFYKYSSLIFYFLFPIGFTIGLVFGGIVHWLFYGGTAGDNRKPYYTSSHITGGSMGSGIIYTDEEEKNAKQNERQD